MENRSFFCQFLTFLPVFSFCCALNAQESPVAHPAHTPGRLPFLYSTFGLSFRENHVLTTSSIECVTKQGILFSLGVVRFRETYTNTPADFHVGLSFFGNRKNLSQQVRIINLSSGKFIGTRSRNMRFVAGAGLGMAFLERPTNFVKRDPPQLLASTYTYTYETVRSANLNLFMRMDFPLTFLHGFYLGTTANINSQAPALGVVCGIQLGYLRKART
jgi:hypothetical protein